MVTFDQPKNKATECPQEAQVSPGGVSHTARYSGNSRDPRRTLSRRMGHHRVLCSEHAGLGRREGRVRRDLGNGPSDVHDLCPSVVSITSEPCLDIQDHGTTSVWKYDHGTVQVSTHRTEMARQAS